MRFRILIMLIIVIPTFVFSQAVNIAEDYRDLEWYVYLSNITYNYSSSGDPQLGYTDNYPCDWEDQMYTYQYGMPYHYGGRDTFDQWDDEYDLGTYGPGAHDDHHPGSLTWAAGIDCSGLVGRCWEVSEDIIDDFSCTYIVNSYPEITQGQLLPGDCFARAGFHALLFHSWYDATQVNVIEAVATDYNEVVRNQVVQNIFEIDYLLYTKNLTMYSETGTNIEDTTISERIIKLTNYPNPFNPITTISYSLAANIKNPQIEIYNLKGQKVYSFQLEEKAGESSIVWNGTDENDKSVSSGVYFYQLVNEGKSVQSRKMLDKFIYC
ncbi:MAG: T9SS type A sorting domain-containing protein [Armatimonadetes bacterium]|nr:T9SS type A sorting domain-containing protein [Armatimonadota bacterium]